MFDMAFNGVSSATQLLVGVTVLAVGFVILMTFVKTRALMPTLAMALVGGIVIWLIVKGGAGQIGDGIDTDVDQLTAGGVTAVVDPGPVWTVVT